MEWIQDYNKREVDPYDVCKIDICPQFCTQLCPHLCGFHYCDVYTGPKSV